MADKYFANKSELTKYRVKNIVIKTLLYAFLTIFALFMLTPFLFMVIGSFIEGAAFEKFTLYADFSQLGFEHWSFENYIKVFATTYLDNLGNTVTRPSFAQYFLNTFIVAISSTAVTVVTAVLASFAFARLEFKGKDLLFTLLLATMMIPGEMMVITNYQTTIMLNWKFTFSALILVHGVSVFYIFYLRQTFQQIPNELYLAAKVDGVGDIGYLMKVMVPIAMPTIMTIVILCLMGSWNSFIWPTLVANGNWAVGKSLFGINYDMRLVSNGLMSLFSSEIAKGQDSVKIAGSMVVTAPLFVFFICFRKYIMSGKGRAGIKG